MFLKIKKIVMLQLLKKTSKINFKVLSIFVKIAVWDVMLVIDNNSTVLDIMGMYIFNEENG